MDSKIKIFRQNKAQKKCNYLNKIEIYFALLSKNAIFDLNSKNRNDALLYSSQNEHLETVKYLVERQIIKIYIT